MGEKHVDFGTVVKKPGGGFQITIKKKTIAEPLGLKGDERVKVYLDKERRRWTYELSE